MAELTDAEFLGSAAAPKAASQKELSDAQFLGAANAPFIGSKPENDRPAAQALRALRIAGGGLAPIADFILNIPFAFPLEVGGALGGTVKAAIKGESGEEAFMIGRDVGRQFAEPISNPVQKIMKSLDAGELYEQSLTQKGLEKVSSLIDDADKWLNKNVKLPNGESVPEGAFSQVLNAAMFGMGRKGAELRSKLIAEKQKQAGVTEAPAPEAAAPVADTITSVEAGKPRLKLKSQTGAVMPENPRAALGEFSDADLKALGITRRELADILADRKLATVEDRVKYLAGLGVASGTSMVLLSAYDEAEKNGVGLMDVLKSRVTREPYLKPGELEQEPEQTPEGTMLGGAEKLLPLALIAGAVKGKGGMWHPEAVTRLADAIAPGRRMERLPNDPGQPQLDAEVAWSQRAVRNYLNKYAGTEGDPLKDVEIPFGTGTERWERITDSAFYSRPLKGNKGALKDVPVEQATRLLQEKPGEPVWETARTNGEKALKDYLSHVGDYLRQNVPPEKLGQYDLVRAVRETAANDARMAKQMEKAASAETAQLPVYKEYPNGFKWVELKLPEKLTPEMEKQVKPTIDIEGGPERLRGTEYIAVDQAGKPVKNTYTGESVRGRTPQEAILGKWLAEEGNQMGHCVGGYCEGVASGESRIFSLRDQKGKSHVTIETGMGEDKGYAHTEKGMTPEEIRRVRELRPYRDPRTGQVDMSQSAYHTEDIIKALGEKRLREIRAAEGEDILQIKGKQNRAPVAEYLPYVQDFVRGGKWGEVEDLSNTGLIDLANNKRDAGFLELAKQKFGNERFVPGDQADALWKQYVDSTDSPYSRGLGGRQAGSADPKLLVPLGAAAAAAILSDEHVWRNALLAGIGTYAVIQGAGGKGTVGGGLEYALGTASTNLGIAGGAALRLAARNLDRFTLKHVNEAYDQVHPWLAETNRLSKAEFAKIDEAYISGDPAKMAEAIKGKPALVDAYRKVRNWLDEMKDKQIELKRYKEGLVGYLPRVVKDLDGLKEALGSEQRRGLEKLLFTAEADSIKKNGRPLTEVEQSLIINRYLFTEDMTSSLPGFAKARRVKAVTPELRPFYETMQESLLRYASAAVQDLETARFFGRDIQVTKQGERKYTNVDESIGAVVAREMKENKWTPEQAETVRAILKSRLEGGERAMSGPMADVRNLTNIGLLGSLQSAATQLGDSMFVIYHHGLKPTLSAVVSKLTGDTVHPGEFGLVNHLAEELASSRPTGKALQKIFKVAFAPIDLFAKEMNLTASFSKNKNLARTAGGQSVLARKWADAYGEDFPQLVRDLQKGQRTDLVDSLLWSELADAQPISKMEMPQAYLDHPNGRILFQMKTYALKQADVIRRDAYHEIQQGSKARGLKNLAAFATVLALSNVPGDLIKSWLSGEDIDLTPSMAEMLLRNFGMSRYSMEQSAKGELGKIAGDQVKPAALSLLDAFKQPEKAVQYIPVVGKTIYDRFMGGAEKREKANKAAEKREANRKRKAETE